jgi:putative oxidoreductase
MLSSTAGAVRTRRVFGAGPMPRAIRQHGHSARSVNVAAAQGVVYGFSMASQGGRSFGLLIARILLGALFIYTGVHAAGQTSATAVKLGENGYPVPHIMAIIAVVAQIAGGASLVLGVLTPLGCIALILFLLPTTYTFHMLDALKGDVRQTIECGKNLAIVGGLIALLFTGPGAFSVDGRIMGKG